MEARGAGSGTHLLGDDPVGGKARRGKIGVTELPQDRDGDDDEFEGVEAFLLASYCYGSTPGYADHRQVTSRRVPVAYSSCLR